MSQVKGLDHLNLSVDSFAQTRDWYAAVFGFECVEEGVQDGVVWGVLKAGDAMLCIYEYPQRQLLDRYALDERRLHGFNHFGLRIVDEQAWEQTVEEHGLALLYGGPIEWPHSTAWYIKDPTGYEIEVALWKDDQIRFG